MSIRIFEDSNHANIYAKFRPVVPNNVIDNVLNFLKEKIHSNELVNAVDVGCGSGQGTNKFSKYFKNVYGFDVSPAQIKEAKDSQHSQNVYYDVSPAETLPNIESNSVQLLTACEAAHWFDFPKFFKESDRILVNNGVVALIGYYLPEPTDPSNPDDLRLTNLLLEAYNNPLLAPYKNPNLVSIEKHYHDFKFPDNYQFIHEDNVLSSSKAYASDLVGYVESWSLFQGLVAKDKQLADKYIETFKQNLKDILQTEDLYNKQITINYNYFIAMGRKVK